MSQQSIILSMNRLFVAYMGSEQMSYALHDVTLDIHKGSWTAIVGANGSGKSTLSRIIADLNHPTEGYITKAEGTHVHIVLQNPQTQILGDTLSEEISLSLNRSSADTSDHTNTIRLILDEVGLCLSQHTLTDQLSGGEMQLLNIAVAVAAGANVFVLDEVTSMLDHASRDQVIQVVRKLNDKGATIIWLTHRTEELGFAERVVLLDRGHVAYDGSTRNFLYGAVGAATATPCEHWGMELPYVVQVVRQLAKRGYSLPEQPLLPQELSEAIQWRCQL